MAKKNKNELKFETTTFCTRFFNRRSKEDDKKKHVSNDGTNDALIWLSLVDERKTENKTKPKTRYQNRTSHRDKTGWDRFLCSL